MSGEVNVARGSAERYLAGVRSALSDLPEPEVAEIVDDVATHLAELRADLGDDVDLTERLGSPEAYAAELRSAAGYAPAPPATRPAGSGGARAALVVLVIATLLGALAGLWLYSGVGLAVLLLAGVLVLLALPLVVHAGPRVEAVAALPAVRRVVAARPEPDSPAGRAVGFVETLQSAWWLLRAFVAAMLVGLVFGRGGSFEWSVVALTLVFAAVSVWLGHRSRADRRWMWAVLPLNAFAAVLVLTGWPGWASAAGYVSYGDSVGYEVYPAYPGLWQDGERQIEDIRPVDANGVPLTGVYLFDQSGRPIDATSSCVEVYGGPTSDQRAEPYPRGTSEFDERTGECVRVPPGPLVVAVPTGAADPSGTTPAPSRGPSSADIPPPPTDQAPPTG